jgi:hypothetical protein
MNIKQCFGYVSIKRNAVGNSLAALGSSAETMAIASTSRRAALKTGFIVRYIKIQRSKDCGEKSSNLIDEYLNSNMMPGTDNVLCLT